MHKTDAANNVANEFSDGTPPLTPGTSLGAKWHNTVQRELVKLVEDAGIALDDGDDTQVRQALDVLYGRLAAENTWTADQEIDGDLNVTGTLNVNPGGIYSAGTLLLDGGANVASLTTGGAVVAASVSTGSGAISGGAVSGSSLSSSGTLAVTGLTRLTGGVENATAATASVPQNALDLKNGNLKLSGAMPNSNVGFSNTLGPNSFAKAHCVVEIASGTPTLQGKGKNITSVATVSNGGLSTGVLRVTFATPMASVWYTAIPAVMSSSLPMKGAAVVVLNANYCDIAVFTTGTGGTVVDLLSGSAVVSLIVMGEQ